MPTWGNLLINCGLPIESAEDVIALGAIGLSHLVSSCSQSSEFEQRLQLSKSVSVGKQGLARELAPADSIYRGPHPDKN